MWSQALAFKSSTHPHAHTPCKPDHPAAASQAALKLSKAQQAQVLQARSDLLASLAVIATERRQLLSQLALLMLQSTKVSRCLLGDCPSSCGVKELRKVSQFQVLQLPSITATRCPMSLSCKRSLCYLQMPPGMLWHTAMRY